MLTGFRAGQLAVASDLDAGLFYDAWFRAAVNSDSAVRRKPYPRRPPRESLKQASR